jgi:hypothetical protein
MTRGFFRLTALAVVLPVTLFLALAGCGSGGGGGAARPMVLVEFLFVDETLTPSFPTGTADLPRNARIVFKFSELVNPESINEQTIQIREEPIFQTVPLGSFQVDGDRVIFDPTITKTGQPNPFGFDAFAQYVVEMPSVEDRETVPETDVVENLDGDPLLTSFLTKFKTGDKFLRELVPPQVEEVFFVPEPDPLTKNVPGNGFLGIRFSEAMDPATFVLSTSTPQDPSETIDIRYDCNDPFNISNGVNCRPIPMNTPTHNPAADTYFFRPIFSFGSKKYKFTVSIGQGVTDLAGNLLVNPRSFGPFTVDGNGQVEGDILVETFANTTDRDPGQTSADWGQTEQGFLRGSPITSRRAFITGWQQGNKYRDSQQWGRYYPLVDPLVGAALQVAQPNLQPPTNQGRRVMWSFSDEELGPDGSVTAVAWGPDSNATFAAKYPTLILRIGFQKTASMNLASNFTGNYLGSPLTMYEGEYDVVQKANVGDAPEPEAQPVILPPPANQPPAQIMPLYNFWGYTNWPAPTSFFDWDQGDPAVIEDRVLVFDASAEEGNTWQQLRGWFAFDQTSFGGVTALIPGYPQRRMLATFEEETPNPPANVALGILNPEPSITDTAFTFTTRVSLAQSRFYTPASADALGNVYPPPYSNAKTRGAKSDYLLPTLTPAVQAGGALVRVEFQGATAVLATSNRTTHNTAVPFTPWTLDVNACDGFPYLRWRLRLTSNLNSNTVARLGSITVPVISLP